MMIIDVSKIFSLATEPVNKVSNRFWFDTANNLLKRYNKDSDKWEPITIDTLGSDKVQVKLPTGDVISLTTFASQLSANLDTIGDALDSLEANKQNNLQYYKEIDGNSVITRTLSTTGGAYITSGSLSFTGDKVDIESMGSIAINSVDSTLTLDAYKGIHTNYSNIYATKPGIGNTMIGGQFEQYDNYGNKAYIHGCYLNLTRNSSTAPYESVSIKLTDTFDNKTTVINTTSITLDGNLVALEKDVVLNSEIDTSLPSSPAYTRVPATYLLKTELDKKQDKFYHISEVDSLRLQPSVTINPYEVNIYPIGNNLEDLSVENGIINIGNANSNYDGFTNINVNGEVRGTAIDATITPYGASDVKIPTTRAVYNAISSVSSTITQELTALEKTVEDNLTVSTDALSTAIDNLDSRVVHLSGKETITGTKTFGDPIRLYTSVGGASIYLAENGTPFTTYINNENIIVGGSGSITQVVIDSSKGITINNDPVVTSSVLSSASSTLSTKIDSNFGILMDRDATLDSKITNLDNKVTTASSNLVNLINTKTSTVYEFKGSDTYANIIKKTGDVGDVWNSTTANDIYPAGTNYAWDGIAWEPLGGNIDLSTYQTKEIVATGLSATTVATALEELESTKADANNVLIKTFDEVGEIQETNSYIRAGWFGNGYTTIGPDITQLDDYGTETYIYGGRITIDNVVQHSGNQNGIFFTQSYPYKEYGYIARDGETNGIILSSNTIILNGNITGNSIDTIITTASAKIPTSKAVSDALSTKANDSEVVKLTGDQGISGNKIFGANGAEVIIGQTNLNQSPCGISFPSSGSGESVFIGETGVYLTTAEKTSGAKDININCHAGIKIGDQNVPTEDQVLKLNYYEEQTISGPVKYYIDGSGSTKITGSFIDIIDDYGNSTSLFDNKLTLKSQPIEYPQPSTIELIKSAGTYGELVANKLELTPEYIKLDGNPVALEKDVVLNSEIDTTLPDVPVDTKVPSTKLLKTELDKKQGTLDWYSEQDGYPLISNPSKIQLSTDGTLDLHCAGGKISLTSGNVEPFGKIELQEQLISTSPFIQSGPANNTSGRGFYVYDVQQISTKQYRLYLSRAYEEDRPLKMVTADPGTSLRTTLTTTEQSALSSQATIFYAANIDDPYSDSSSVRTDRIVAGVLRVSAVASTYIDVTSDVDGATNIVGFFDGYTTNGTYKTEPKANHNGTAYTIQFPDISNDNIGIKINRGGYAFGDSVNAKGNHALAVGHDNTAAGMYSFASGRGNNVLGYASGSFGAMNTVEAEGSLAVGNKNQIIDNFNLAYPGFNFVAGYQNTLSGTGNSGVFGQLVHAEKLQNSLVTGYNTHIQGSNILANTLSSNITGNTSLFTGSNLYGHSIYRSAIIGSCEANDYHNTSISNVYNSLIVGTAETINGYIRNSFILTQGQDNINATAHIRQLNGTLVVGQDNAYTSSYNDTIGGIFVGRGNETNGNTRPYVFGVDNVLTECSNTFVNGYDNTITKAYDCTIIGSDNNIDLTHDYDNVKVHIGYPDANISVNKKSQSIYHHAQTAHINTSNGITLNTNNLVLNANSITGTCIDKEIPLNADDVTTSDFDKHIPQTSAVKAYVDIVLTRSKITPITNKYTALSANTMEKLYPLSVYAGMPGNILVNPFIANTGAVYIQEGSDVIDTAFPLYPDQITSIPFANLPSVYVGAAKANNGFNYVISFTYSAVQNIKQNLTFTTSSSPVEVKAIVDETNTELTLSITPLTGTTSNTVSSVVLEVFDESGIMIGQKVKVTPYQEDGDWTLTLDEDTSSNVSFTSIPMVLYTFEGVQTTAAVELKAISDSNGNVTLQLL